MRYQSLLAITLICASAATAQRFTPVSREQAEQFVAARAAAPKEANSFNAPVSRVSMYIWSDKYTYEVGQPLTVRWTVKPNNDLYPYTIFAYTVNNQTGRKTYLPGGTQTPTDVFGNTAEKGFQPTQMAAATKAVVVGAGGLFPAVTIPNELGMHTIVVQLCDYTGTRAIKTAYMKIGVVKGTTVISGEINSSRTLTNDTRWELRGIVYVKGGATLTVEPGTFVFGQPGTTPPSALIVTQNGKIMANGTKARPIIMTSSQPFGQRVRGDWGGLVMLGKAPINVGGNIVGGATCGPDGCRNAPGTFFIEGLVGNADSLYGGTDPNHSCGELRYVRVEYAGTILSPNNELNSFTWGGCGKGTVSEHLQAIYGKDDSFEWFGGTNDAKYLVGTYGADDFLDVQIGYTGRVQHVIAVANADNSNRCIEADNYERDFTARPLGRWTVYNLTCVGNGGTRGFDETDASAVYVRRGAGGFYNNILVFNWMTRGIGGADFASVLANGPENLGMDGVLMWNNGGLDNAVNTQTVAGLQQFVSQRARNVMTMDPRLRRPLEYSDPDFRGGPGSPVFRANWTTPPEDGFFDQWASWIGGIGDYDWTEEWTTFHQEEDLRP